MTPNALTQCLSSQVLADIIQDFLEMTCRLAAAERAYLVAALVQGPVSAEAIQIHPAFSVDKRMIVVGNTDASECWLYAPETGKILKSKWQE